jgi:hypothetical protein
LAVVDDVGVVAPHIIYDALGMGRLTTPHPTTVTTPVILAAWHSWHKWPAYRHKRPAHRREHGLLPGVHEYPLGRHEVGDKPHTSTTAYNHGWLKDGGYSAKEGSEEPSPLLPWRRFAPGLILRDIPNNFGIRLNKRPFSYLLAITSSGRC